MTTLTLLLALAVFQTQALWTQDIIHAVVAEHSQVGQSIAALKGSLR